MENAGFWAIAGLMAFGVAALLILSLLAARRATLAPTATEDLQIYRDQLREVDRDIARGTLADAEGQRLQTEIARRLLEADRKVRTAGAAAGGARTLGGVAVAAGAILLAAVAALWLYGREGLPGYPDLPIRTRLAEADARMATRPAQADYVASLPPWPVPDIPPDYRKLVEELRAKVDPATATDPRGLALLAQNEARLGNFETALAAQRRLIAVLGQTATADDHAQLAEMLVMQAQGYVSPEAELALIEALKREPGNSRALYYSGLMFAQSGRYDRAFVIWRDLLEKGPREAPWMATMRQQLVEVADLAGVPYTPPPDTAPVAGPDAQDMAAAADMTPAERQEMIEGMVAQLSDRLASEGGSAEEWAQLIRALGVLGRTGEAGAIYAEARTRFTGRDADLAAIAAAAGDAGLAP